MRPIRFKSRPLTIRKKSSIYPNGRYNNKLHKQLQLFSKIKTIESKVKDNKFAKFDVFEIVKKEINTPHILNQCQLLKFPIKLIGNYYVETDYIEPHWNGNNSPFYKLISKLYILINENLESNELEIIEYKRLEAYKEGKRVRIYKIKMPVGFEVIYEV